MDIKKDILSRVSLVYIGILLFGILIITRAIMIQSLKDPRLLDISRKQEMKVFVVEAIRGNIYSDDGSLLAVSVPHFDISMDLAVDSLTDKVFRDGVDSLAMLLSALFKDKTSSEYLDMLWDARRNKARNLIIQKDIRYHALRQLTRFPIFRRGQFRGGLIVKTRYEREWPYQTLARRTIGYEPQEGAVGFPVGIESSFAKELEGIDGQQIVRRVGKSDWMPISTEDQIEPQNGHDIISTLNVEIQDITESALRKALITDSADHGCAMVMEVSTGYVKAIANLGRTYKGTYEEILNYAIGESGECLEPGSTFKLASFLVVMEDGKVEPSTPIATGNGTVYYSGRKMSDAHQGGFGTITAQEVLEKSSNVGTSKIIYNAYATKPGQYIDGLYRIGINRKLNLQIPCEGIPYIKNTKSKYWSSISIPWMSIGYEVKLAPVHLLTLYNAVANNGTMVKPLLVSEVRSNGKTIQHFPPQVINPKIASSSTITKVKMMLEGVVEHGTANNIRTSIYRIAGKTGTAQIAQKNLGYRKNNQVQYTSSFVGYFPADNPRYSIIVTITNPKKGKYYGAAIAAPVFREIADKLYASQPDIICPLPNDSLSKLPFAHNGKQQDLQEIFGALDIPVIRAAYQSQWTSPANNIRSVAFKPMPVSQSMMPDVRGMGMKDALYLLEQLGVKVMVSGKGTVVRQSIPAGTMIRKGMEVMLELKT